MRQKEKHMNGEKKKKKKGGPEFFSMVMGENGGGKLGDKLQIAFHVCCVG